MLTFMLMSMTSPTVSAAQSVKNTKSICRSAYAFCCSYTIAFFHTSSFSGMDIFLRVDRRRAARFPYNGNFTVYGAFPAAFSRQRKGYQPCSLQCTGRGYWCGTGNHSGLPQSAAPQPPQRLPPAQGRAQRWQYQQTILSDPGASVAPS